MVCDDDAAVDLKTVKYNDCMNDYCQEYIEWCRYGKQKQVEARLEAEREKARVAQAEAERKKAEAAYKAKIYNKIYNRVKNNKAMIAKCSRIGFALTDKQKEDLLDGKLQSEVLTEEERKRYKKLCYAAKKH